MCPMSLLLVEWCEYAELHFINSRGRQDVGHTVTKLESAAGVGGSHQGGAISLLYLLQHTLRVVVFSNFRKVMPNYAGVPARGSREK